MIYCPRVLELAHITKGLNQMKAIVNVFINVLYGACALVGYIGLLDSRVSMVVGCLALALGCNLVKRDLRLGAYK